MDEAMLKKRIFDKVCFVSGRVIKEISETGIEDAPLTGERWGLAARDLLYLFFEVEKEFGIHIQQTTLETNSFNSINGIKRIVLECHKQ